MNNKLYKVTLKGMTYQKASGVVNGIAYVVAKDLTSAYNKMHEFLKERDIGYDSDRQLDKIELLAENEEYPDTDYRLFI